MRTEKEIKELISKLSDPNNESIMSCDNNQFCKYKGMVIALKWALGEE